MNPHGWRYALLTALAVYVVLVLAAFAAYRGHLDAEATGAIFAPYLVAGVVVGFVSRAARSAWRWWRYLLWVFGVGLVLRVLVRVGQGVSGP